MTRYATVDTRTLKGLKKAERLHATGWTCYSVGLYILKFYKRTGKEGPWIYKRKS